MDTYTFMHIHIPHTYTLHEPRPPAAAQGAWEWMRAGGENLVYELVLYVLGLL